MKDAFEAGALDAITEVVTKHKGDEEVICSSTGCLSSLASKPAYAGRLVESGALLSLVDSVAANPTGAKVRQGALFIGCMCVFTLACT